MSDVTRLALVDPTDASRSELKTLLLGIEAVWLEAECSRYEFFADVVGQSSPEIALIALDADPEKGLELVAKVSAEYPATKVLVVSASADGATILKAMRNGAKEFLTSPLTIEDFLAALDRIRQTGGGAAGTGKVRSSQVITIAGVSGGVGCTSLAINLGCILAQNEANSVVIIDLDMALGDADIWLDLIPDYTIQDVTENISRLDFSLLRRSLTKHECGVFLLPRPDHLDEKTAITPEELRRVVTLLKATFTHLIIDVSKSYSPLDLAAMNASDVTLLVTQFDLPCLKNVVRLIPFFEYHEGLSEKVKIVVNRLGLADTQISTKQALDTIGRDIYAQIPNDYAAMVESRNNGVPLATHSAKAKVTRALEDLARMIDGRDYSDSGEEVAEAKGKRSFLSFMKTGK